MSRIFAESHFRIESKVKAFVLHKPSCLRAIADSGSPDSDLPGSNSPDSDSPWIASDPAFAAECGDAFREIRLALSAVLSLFGGPNPTRGDDPPGAAARPRKLELLTVISNRRSNDWHGKKPADQEEIPYPAAA
jgi:hypothetical protein